MWGDFTCKLLEGHDLASFGCGEPTLDDFLKTTARKQRRVFGSTFVASPVATPLQVAGYYTLASHSLVSAAPATLKKKSSYARAPVTLLGRLAVSTAFQGRGLGEWILLDALSRAYDATADAASVAVVTVPLHEKASAFYVKYGFQALPDSPRLFMTMTTIADLRLSR
jgi:GNAT superfamily N-acetyltransferase